MPWERDVDNRFKVGSASIRRVADGNWAPARATRDGSLYTADWIQGCIIEGKGHEAGIGLLSDSEALQAAVITTLRPSLWIRVPTDTTILPIHASITVEDTAAVSNFEAVLGASIIDIGNGTSSAADFGPINMVTRGGVGKCTARQEATGDTTTAGDPPSTFWRVIKFEDNVQTPATAGPSNFEWAGYPRLPVLVGPATLQLNIGAIAGAAAPIVFATLQWLEFDTKEIR